MFRVNRRNFISLTAGGLALVGSESYKALAMAPDRPPMLEHQPFSFVFLTDLHIQPELKADMGCHMAFVKARNISADFAIFGGDHVFDALGVHQNRATALMDIYKRTAEDLTLPAYHTIGNHDCFGVYTKSGAQPTDPLYGKKYFEDNLGRLYYSFNHKGVHIVVLDSIGITDDRAYEGRIDAAQLSWLAQDLAALPKGMPIIVSTHIPLVTAFEDYEAPPAHQSKHHALSVINAYEVLALFDHYNVIGVFQGHTHVVERVDWHGVPYITGGAVSGNWWHGSRYGTAEGFLVVDVADGAIKSRYETFGFHSVDPKNT
ncbi:metallophosphoesterase family protein [Zymomonas mobilis]|uniref:metallophosphoesterase family protein n=1 Tax=Zymomonas mobilis TaxID=542 RepID=UPI0039EA92C5